MCIHVYVYVHMCRDIYVCIYMHLDVCVWFFLFVFVCCMCYLVVCLCVFILIICMFVLRNFLRGIRGVVVGDSSFSKYGMHKEFDGIMVYGFHCFFCG
jgi:hypothetical protein